jgi:hypothetical protein
MGQKGESGNGINLMGLPSSQAAATSAEEKDIAIATTIKNPCTM